MNPHFYRLRKEAVGKDQVLGSATERCERDFSNIVLPVSKSNETQEQLHTAPNNELHKQLRVGVPSREVLRELPPQELAYNEVCRLPKNSTRDQSNVWENRVSTCLEFIKRTSLTTPPVMPRSHRAAI